VRSTARIAATFNRSGAARDNVVGVAAMPAVSSAHLLPTRRTTTSLPQGAAA
jgi:hypothetical protein